jgi:hypothetical protein
MTSNEQQQKSGSCASLSPEERESSLLPTKRPGSTASLLPLSRNIQKLPVASSRHHLHRVVVKRRDVNASLGK